MKIFKTDTATDGATQLQERLVAALGEDKRVLWLVTGGSNIPISVSIMNNISDEQSRNLTVALTDERFGPAGHKDSNWQQIIEAGFNGKSAKHVAVLQGELKDLEYTAQQYGAVLGDLFAENDVIIAQYGMGPDGHISGILPNSSAVEAMSLVYGYHTEQYDRITTTFEAIKRCDVAYLFVFGAERRSALESLARDVPLNDQPAQILKQIPEAYVFNDQIGELV